jgi:hypothetical protein
MDLKASTWKKETSQHSNREFLPGSVQRAYLCTQFAAGFGLKSWQQVGDWIMI